jgi:hypothetical protein
MTKQLVCVVKYVEVANFERWFKLIESFLQGLSGANVTRTS